ncbi:hypothetical protein BJM39_31905 [Salmonella enterica subsp. enterica serovar Javiana]|nr:hypothetical protein BJM39_31905 [Salmonella enterica subsp. enterica serovar Javiana]
MGAEVRVGTDDEPAVALTHLEAHVRADEAGPLEPQGGTARTCPRHPQVAHQVVPGEGPVAERPPDPAQPQQGPGSPPRAAVAVLGWRHVDVGRVHLSQASRR